MFLSLATSLFSTLLIGAAAPPHPSPTDITYGDVYFEETRDRQTPLLYLGVGYADTISNSYLNLPSLVTTGQVRVWKYFSTGVMGQFIHADYSSAGSTLKSLSQFNINAEIATPHWGVFSLSYLQFMLGQWNVLNLVPLQVDLLFGGGAGALKKSDDFDSSGRIEASYLWSVEQRLRFYKNAGVFVSLFGHRGGNYLSAGLHVNYD